MEFKYISKKEYDKKLETKEYSCLGYFSKRKMRKMYPDKGYIVAGGIGKGLHDKAGDIYINDVIHDYYTVNYKRWHYGIAGYISIGDNQYLAVVKSRLFKNLWISFMTILLIAGLVFCIYNMAAVSNELDPNAKDYTPANSQVVEPDKDHIALPGYTEIKMQADTDVAYLALWNPPKNPCYFKFTIYSKKENQLLYESGLIAPGKAVTEIRLNKKIPRGSHEVVVEVHTYDLDNKEVELNGAKIETKLIALD